MRSWGETLARLVDRRIAAPVATIAAIRAIAAAYRCNGLQIIEATNGTTWWFDDDSTAPAGPSVLVPDAGSGRWLSTAGGAGGPSTKVVFVRGCPTGALAAYTRVGNVITANAAGALGAQDGVTYVAGERLLLVGAATASDLDNGPYQVTAPGTGATAFVLTRIGEADASAEVVSGMYVHVSEGTANGNEWFTLSTADPIVLNTTALTFTQVPSFVDLASTAASQGASLIGVQDAAARIAGTTAEAALAELAGRLLGAVANAAALGAVTAAQRVDGMLIVKLDDYTVWSFAGASAVAASDWVIAPAAGAGRWLRKDAEPGLVLPPVADNAALIALAATDRVDGSLVVQLDTLTIWTYDLGSVAGATDWVVVPTDGVGRWHRYYTTLADLATGTAGHGANLVALQDAGGIITATTAEGAGQEFATDINTIRPGKPMSNRLRMLGAPGAIVEGDTVTIGANVFEFRASTPPAGGTAGRIWVYRGADSAASRANFIDAVNGVIDAARITYNGALVITFLAAAGVTLGDVVIVSAAAAGGAPVANATATATAETLTTATDIWDAAVCYGGRLQTTAPVEFVSIALNAAHIAKSNAQFRFMAPPVEFQLVNRQRAQNEAYAVVGNTVSLTLAGGVSPNNQAGDIVDCILFA